MKHTPYAIAHMRLIGIQVRFNQFLQRQQPEFRQWNWIGINHAKREGAAAISQVQEDQEAFDRAIQPKPVREPGFSASDREIDMFVTAGYKTCFARNSSNELLVIKDNGAGKWQTVINMGPFDERRAKDLAEFIQRIAPKGAPR